MAFRGMQVDGSKMSPKQDAPSALQADCAIFSADIWWRN